MLYVDKAASVSVNATVYWCAGVQLLLQRPLAFSAPGVGGFRNGNKRGVATAITTDVDRIRPWVRIAERARSDPRVSWICPRRAASGPEAPAVRPAEEHPVVHAGLVGLAAAQVLRAGVLGAAGGTRFVRSGDRNLANRPVVPYAVVGVALLAVVGGRGRTCSCWGRGRLVK